MSKLVFPGSGVPGDQIGRFLSESFGFKVLPHGKDWAVQENDPALLRMLRATITAHPPIPFDSTNFSSAAAAMAKFAAPEFDEWERPSLRVKAEGSMGLISEVEPILTELMAARSNEAEPIIRDKILPFMHEKMSASAAIPVSIQTIDQQTRISFSKIALLMEKHGLD